MVSRKCSSGLALGGGRGRNGCVVFPANVSRYFLPWDQPLLPQAVRFLAGDWAGGKPLDLSRIVVVVPTKQAGRRLREALAAFAAGHQQAVFPPRVFPPERLLLAGQNGAVASPLESLLAWADVLMALDLEPCREVFPVDPPVRNFAWALRQAQEFAGLQGKLAEGGLLMGDVATRAGDFPETMRWRQLGGLERLHAERLHAAGLIDAQAAKISAANHPVTFDDVDRIILLATPDPLPLAVQTLAGHAKAGVVAVVIFAPEAEGDKFDEWGRPLTVAWEQRVLTLPEFEARVHLCADPATQAERIARLALAYEEPEGALAIGVADAEVLPQLESALRRSGQAMFNPEGRAYRHDGLFHLLSALAEVAREPTFEAVEALARCPDIMAYLRGRMGEQFSTARWLAGLDELRARHLPATLAAAREHAGELTRFPQLSRTLAVLEELRSWLMHGAFAEGLAAVLAAIFSERKLDPVREPDARLEAEAVAWMDTVRACAEAEKNFSGLARSDWWELALRLFGEEKRPEEKPEGAVELQGWLELPWENAPHLVVAGVNDGCVPESVAGDPYLPESLRERLGLKTNAARLARDNYLLQALATSRAAGGRLDLLFGKVAVSGEPLRPSRLLLRCADHELPARVKFLFREPELEGNNLAWRRAWKLVPRREPAPTRVAVTALRGWLKCPLRFYFRQVLKMEAVEAVKSEMDAMDFGTLCHSALEAMGLDPVMKTCTDAAVLRGFLGKEFDRQVRRRFGAELTLPLLVQVASAHQRLAKAAEVQARECAEGWVIVEVEKKFEIVIGGITVAGKIDRIERHALTGAVRVLDYKTSDTAVAPVAFHLRGLRGDETVPEWARYTGSGKPRVWTDLQLPLYLHALVPVFGRNITCGYFNLPKASSETGLAVWEDYPVELQESAWRCAEGVCTAITTGKFWPPTEMKGWQAELDDFAALFQQGAAESVAWEEQP